MRTKKEQTRSGTAAAAGERVGSPSPVGIPILSGRTKAEIGRIRRDGQGWAAYALEADGSYRPLGQSSDFAAALAVVPDLPPQPAAVAMTAPATKARRPPIATASGKPRRKSGRTADDESALPVGA